MICPHCTGGVVEVYADQGDGPPIGTAPCEHCCSRPNLGEAIDAVREELTAAYGPEVADVATAHVILALIALDEEATC